MHSNEITAAACDQGSDNEYFPPVETHLIRSRFVAQTFKIQVMLPAQRRGEQARFPVVYATDGNLSFDVFKNIAYSMQHAERDAPRFVLVSIGYPGEGPFAGALLRARDLTFPGYPKLSTEPPAIEGVLRAPHGTKDFLGADDFQSFLQHELVPLIDEKYPTLRSDRTYYGHSAGGGFGIYTLLTNTRLFSNYVISSPGLTFDGRSSGGLDYENDDFVARRVKEFLATGASLHGIKLYLSVGAEEEFEPNLLQWRLTSNCYRMAALLRTATAQGLQLTTEVFPGASHMTVWPMAFIRGLQAVFGTGPWRSSRAMGASSP